MDMQVKREGRCLEIHLKGELDHHAAKEMMGRLDSETELVMPLQLTLDFSGVTFMDSSGIGLIMGRYRLMLSLGGQLRLQGAGQRLERMIRLAGLDKLPIWNTKEGKEETHETNQ